jgi:hypothetical protein
MFKRKSLKGIYIIGGFIFSFSKSVAKTSIQYFCMADKKITAINYEPGPGF